MIITGCRAIDKRLTESQMTLFYGPAATGKTAVLLTIASNTCKGKPCLFISTEGTLYHERIAGRVRDFQNILFYDTINYDELLEHVITAAYFIPVRNIFIDSVNALYRIHAYEENALQKLGLMLGILRRKNMEAGTRIYASAQVRAGYEEDEEEAVASGMRILDYWFDTIIRLGSDENGRFAEIVKPSHGVKAYFEITGKGVEWIGECTG